MRFAGWSAYWSICRQVWQYQRYTFQAFWLLLRQIWWDIRRTKKQEDEMIKQWPAIIKAAFADTLAESIAKTQKEREE